MKRICLAALAAMTVAFAPAALAAPTKVNRCPTTITQPGLYELQDNLDSLDTCITVRADSVTIDLSGFRIRGNGKGTAVASQVGFLVRDTTVRNGTVTNFENGVDIMHGAVENLRSLDNANVGILVWTGSVRNSRAEGNTNNHGISVGGRSQVTGNFSIGNRTGISASHASIVHGNTVADNSMGIVTVGTGLSIANNSIFNNGGFGIYVECPALVLANTVLFHHTANLRLNGAGCTEEHNATQ